jgi:hypothetical protein
MTQQEWIKQAEDYEARAAAEFEGGDELSAEYLERKAAACRFAACHGTVEETP